MGLESRYGPNNSQPGPPEYPYPPHWPGYGGVSNWEGWPLHEMLTDRGS